MDVDEVCLSCLSDSSNVDDNELCSICYHTMKHDESHTLECEHKFHTGCILKWFRSKQDTCPLCREQPVVKLKTPDVFHRAKTLIEQETKGITSDPFIKRKMLDINESERMILIQEKELLNHKEMFKNVIKPRKEQILRHYRLLRKEFKEKSSPLLKELDRIDEAEHTQRKVIRKAINQERKKKREAMRDIGLHNIQSNNWFSFEQQRTGLLSYFSY